MGYYAQHVFVCTNQRDNGEACCHARGSADLWKYLKTRMQELGLHDAGQVRINKSGCLGRCELGPLLVIYPQETWYTFVDREDIDEIIDQHLIHGQIVDRLKV